MPILGLSTESVTILIAVPINSEWIKKYVHFHGVNSRVDFKNDKKRLKHF